MHAAMTYLFKKPIIGAAVLLLTAISAARADSATTGNLDDNIITGAGAYTWTPTINAPFGTANGTLEVEHALWVGPPVLVHAFVNGVEVGSFLVEQPAFFGTVVSTLNIGGLLVDGANEIRLDGLNASGGAYGVNSITVNFDVLPEPPPPPPNEQPPVSTNHVAASVHKERLHLLTRTAVVPGENSSATGEMRLHVHKRGECDLATFDLNVRGLSPRTEYTLVVVTDDAMVPVKTLKTDKKGRLNFDYHTHSGKNGGEGLPDGISSVAAIRGVALQQGGVVAASAWVEDSTDLLYAVKKNLTPTNPSGTARGALKLLSNAEDAFFRLGAAGLTPGQAYHVAFNGTVAASLTADAEGRVGFVELPAGAPTVLALRSVALLDASNNTVLETSLPE